MGKTRIFFRAGHIAAIRRILSQSLPLSEAEAVVSAKALICLYEQALAAAEGVAKLAAEIGPGAIAAAEGARTEATEALARTQAAAEATAAAAAEAASMDGEAVKARVAAVRALVKDASGDERFSGLQAVAALLRTAQEHAQVWSARAVWQWAWVLTCFGFPR